MSWFPGKSTEQNENLNEYKLNGPSLNGIPIFPSSIENFARIAHKLYLSLPTVKNVKVNVIHTGSCCLLAA